MPPLGLFRSSFDFCLLFTISIGSYAIFTHVRSLVRSLAYRVDVNLA
jgi:hypothetical protein